MVVHHTLIWTHSINPVSLHRHTSCDVGRSVIGPRSLHCIALNIHTTKSSRDRQREALPCRSVEGTWQKSRNLLGRTHWKKKFWLWFVTNTHKTMRWEERARTDAFLEQIKGGWARFHTVRSGQSANHFWLFRTCAVSRAIPGALTQQALNAPRAKLEPSCWTWHPPITISWSRWMECTFPKHKVKILAKAPPYRWFRCWKVMPAVALLWWRLDTLIYHNHWHWFQDSHNRAWWQTYQITNRMLV